MAGREGDVYCTLLTTDDYLPGALVLGHSLRDNGTQKKLAVLVTVDSLSASTLTELRNLYEYVIPVERIANPNLENLSRLNRLDLRYSFTKIELWRQVQFRKIVYLDADVVVLRAPDELFDITASFAAAPDIGWPDCFNSGVMVLNPSMGEYLSLQTLASTGVSFDGADQGLLNQYFEHRPWQRLSFKYNITPSAGYQYVPAYRHFGSQMSTVHFIGKEKPWQKGREMAGSGAYKELVGRWWAVYDRHLRLLPTADEASRGELHPSSTEQQPPHTSHAEHSSSQVEPLAKPEHTTAKVPFTEPGEMAEQKEQGMIQPKPRVEQPCFTAPQAEWDPTRSAPPPESKAEASNLPTEEYFFTQDTNLFRPPTEYPEPPKDMWYEVPKEKPKPRAKPKPIFPWEEYMPPATRVFLEDLPAPEPEPEPELEPAFLDELSVTADDTRSQDSSATTTTSNLGGPSSSVESWQQSFANAWDDVPGIERYVRVVKDVQTKRGKIQVLKDITLVDAPALSSSAQLYLPTRRESLILTDFPTEIERPSLPVTPAPIKKGTFWGVDRDDRGGLPAAEGVPDQADWDPVQKLEELRRTSLLGPELMKSPARKIPNRELLGDAPKGILRNKDEGGGLISPEVGGDGTDESRLEMPPQEYHQHPPLSEGSSPHGFEATDVVETDRDEQPAPGLAVKPAFKEPQFENNGNFSAAAHEAATREDVLSPTER